MLRRFAQRPLDEAYPYVILDARDKKVRRDGVAQGPGGLHRAGTQRGRTPHVLSLELSNRESRSSWKAFVTSLRTRGLHGVAFVVSGDHAGIK